MNEMKESAMKNPFGEYCLQEESRNPYKIACHLMDLEEVPMHGPVHHLLDGSAFLTALHNSGVDFDLRAALEELAERAAQMPGGTCGRWGVCGSASSLGAALAIVHGTGPLSDSEAYRDNLRLTSQILAREAELGGPRCCKRNCFTAILVGTSFVEEHYGITLEGPGSAQGQGEQIRCHYHERNRQCIGERCPYHG